MRVLGTIVLSHSHTVHLFLLIIPRLASEESAQFGQQLYTHTCQGAGVQAIEAAYNKEDFTKAQQQGLHQEFTHREGSLRRILV